MTNYVFLFLILYLRMDTQTIFLEIIRDIFIG